MTAPDEDRRRLLFVVNDAGFFLSHRLPLAIGARKAGYEIHVATPPSHDARRIQDEGLTHHPISMQRGKASLLSELTSFASLYRLFRRIKPDIVHNVTIKPVLYGGIAARMTGVWATISAISGLGYVFISKGAMAGIRRTIIKKIYRNALGGRNSKVILQNPDDLEMLRQQKLLDEDDAVLIRGSGVDVGRFMPLREPEGVVVVTLASRMLWDKGVGEFVEAARMLLAGGVTAKFVLVGGVDESNPARIEEKQLSDWVDESVVEWWGHRDDMLKVFGKTHIVCLPSYREGLPKVLLEAAACGRPIVSTDVPGCREIAVHGENALLVPARDSHDLADALSRMIGDARLRSEMGKRGRKMVEEGFSVEKVVGDTLGLYQRMYNVSDDE